MELKSMKLSAVEVKEMMEPTAMEEPRYPWGLRITLDNEALQKLDLLAMPAVGESLMLHARVHVCRVSKSEVEGEEKRRDLELQITDLALEADHEESNHAQRLYA